MRANFATSQIARLVRLVSPKFNVRVNNAGNLAIEPSAVTGNTLRKYIFYKTNEGVVIRTGVVTDARQKNYTRLGFTENGERKYTFATFNDAVKHFEGTLRRGKYLA